MRLFVSLKCSWSNSKMFKIIRMFPEHLRIYSSTLEVHYQTRNPYKDALLPPCPLSRFLLTDLNLTSLKMFSMEVSQTGLEIKQAFGIPLLPLLYSTSRFLALQTYGEISQPFDNSIFPLLKPSRVFQQSAYTCKLQLNAVLYLLDSTL